MRSCRPFCPSTVSPRFPINHIPCLDTHKKAVYIFAVRKAAERITREASSGPLVVLGMRYITLQSRFSRNLLSIRARERGASNKGDTGASLLVSLSLHPPLLLLQRPRAERERKKRSGRDLRRANLFRFGPRPSLLRRGLFRAQRERISM